MLNVGRCVGYCNFPLFVAAEHQLAESYGAQLRLVYIANPADHPGALVSGRIDASVAPFTNFLVAYANGTNLRIIAGSGMNGLALVCRPEIKALEGLAGKTIGTMRGDTLELMAYDAVKQKGLVGRVKFEYFTDPFEGLEAIRAGRYACVTHVEPFVSRLVHEDGMHVLARGETVWGTDHPDCVLASTPEAIASKREAIKGLIAAMLKAEADVKARLPELAQQLAQPYYQMAPDALVEAVKIQYPKIDIRSYKQFILERGESLKEMGYVTKAPGEEIFDFSLLEEVLKEHPELGAGKP